MTTSNIEQPTANSQPLTAGVRQATFGFMDGSAAGVPSAEVHQTLPERLREAARPDMVQVAPGRWAPRAGSDAPDMTIARWHREPDGTYTPIPCAERMAKLTNRLCRMLGMPGQAETLRRLGRAGNIELIKISPQIYLLNLDSWFNHLRRCAENPELWDKDGKQYRNYVQAQGWVRRDARRQVAGLRNAPNLRFGAGGVSRQGGGGGNARKGQSRRFAEGPGL